jgi:hypothetical protein
LFNLCILVEWFSLASFAASSLPFFVFCSLLFPHLFHILQLQSRLLVGRRD